MDAQTLKNSLCSVEQHNSDLYPFEENGNDATLRKVYMCDIPSEALIIKLDKIKFLKFFKENNGWGFNKHSDYLIVTDDKLVFIEMKSTTSVGPDLKNECIKKFSSDECSMNYADLIFQKMLSKNSFFERREPHYVLLFQALPITKTPTKLGTVTSNTTPDTFRQIPVANESTISFYRTI